MTPLNAPLSRRLKTETPLFSIVEVTINHEGVSMSARNPRREPQTLSLVWSDIFPELWGETRSTGNIDDLYHNLMIHPDISEADKGKLQTVIRQTLEDLP